MQCWRFIHRSYTPNWPQQRVYQLHLQCSPPNLPENLCTTRMCVDAIANLLDWLGISSPWERLAREELPGHTRRVLLEDNTKTEYQGRTPCYILWPSSISASSTKDLGFTWQKRYSNSSQWLWIHGYRCAKSSLGCAHRYRPARSKGNHMTLEYSNPPIY